MYDIVYMIYIYKAVLLLHEVMCMRVNSKKKSPIKRFSCSMKSCVCVCLQEFTRRHAHTHEHTQTHTHTHTLAHLYTHTPGLEAVHIQSASLADVVAVQSASLVDVVAVHSVQSASLAPPEAQEADSEK
jgi:hypothetical protein